MTSAGKGRPDSISPETSSEASAESRDYSNDIATASGVESLTATAVLTLAHRILDRSHAVPTRLKILLDRALESLSLEEKNIILTSCCWNNEDYLRGYKLKVKFDSF